MNNEPQILIDGDTLRVTFDRFDLAAYDTFLRVKTLPEYKIECDDESLNYSVSAPARFAALLGVKPASPDTGDLPFLPALFDDQREILSLALASKRFACWSNCGLGKTPIGLEFARHVRHRTGGRVLVVTLKEIVPQWVEEARKFYGDEMPMAVIPNRVAMKEWCQHGTLFGEQSPWLAVVNYEKFNHKGQAEQVVSEVKCLAGFIADESSRLKSAGGKQKWAVVESSRGVEYKLALTATPAPNEWVEFNDQGRFLERFRKNELCNVYFRRDEKTHRWTIKQHAKEAFFKFMSAWSIYVRDPKAYGWRLNQVDVPEPEYLIHDVPATQAQREFVLDYMAQAPASARDKSGTPAMWVEDLNVIAGQKLSQAAKGFVYEKGGKRKVIPIESNKPRFICDLIGQDAGERGLQTLVWTVYDEESSILAGLCRSMSFGPGVEVLTGKTPEKKRLAVLDRFRHGETRVLISRASMLGFGMNFQFCGSMIFSGWTFSYEQFYQAVRRAYRYGQTRSLRVHIPIVRELEGQMYEALVRKARQDEEAAAEMEKCFAAAMKGASDGACAA